jgi:hypothetical protein
VGDATSEVAIEIATWRSGLKLACVLHRMLADGTVFMAEPAGQAPIAAAA